MKRYLTFLVLILMFTGCKDGKKSKMEPTENSTATESAKAEKQHIGKRIMEQECYGCHDPKATMVYRIAPPMEAIKRHYIDSSVTKEEFTEALIRWVNDPETKTKIPGAHRKFGPMPYMPNPDDAVAQIADYIYDNELERPEGFDAHFQKAHKKGIGMQECNCFDYPDAEELYASTGLDYAKEAKTQLGENLTQAIQEKGIARAIGFCHSEATKLTDSISIMKNAIIKRVTDKPRNPNNLANTEELKHIASFKKSLVSGKEIEPIVYLDKEEVSFYYPITTNTLCLQCHGTPNKQILPETLKILKSLYPKDMAIGYKENEVRGIWSITFDTDN